MSRGESVSGRRSSFPARADARTRVLRSQGRRETGGGEGRVAMNDAALPARADARTSAPFPGTPGDRRSRGESSSERRSSFLARVDARTRVLRSQ